MVRADRHSRQIAPRPRIALRRRIAPRRRISLTGALGLAAALLLGGSGAARAAPWKDCRFNDQPIGCRDSHGADGTVRIVWQDGLAMTYRPVTTGFPLSTLRDSLGGLWQREILVQGNAVFTNTANGNRILVPLR